MAEITVSAVSRSDFGKNASRRLRRTGMVPGVIYGNKTETVSITVDPKAILGVLRSEAGRNAILKIEVEGQGATNAILKAWQVDPVRENFLHADFYRIAMDVALKVTVPLAVRGEARGVKQDGGILEIIMREISVECLPADIPERIELDVTDLDLNRSLRVSDLKVSDKVRILDDEAQVVVHVIAVKEEVVAPAPGTVPAEGTAPATAEPEVLKKGKKDEDAAG